MRPYRLLSVLVLASLPAVLAVAEGPSSQGLRPDVERNSVPPPVLGGPEFGPRPTREPSPMMVEIKQLIADQNLAVEALGTEMSRTEDPDRKMEILQSIHEIKTGTEVAILRVQLRYARQEGRLETARKIEEAIEYLTSPRPVPIPEPRPRPHD
jgi:hypothetical protein